MRTLRICNHHHRHSPVEFFKAREGLGHWASAVRGDVGDVQWEVLSDDWTVVNFNNILQAAFVRIFFCQKITNPNSY
jgi:hypothetical protein